LYLFQTNDRFIRKIIKMTGIQNTTLVESILLYQFFKGKTRKGGQRASQGRIQNRTQKNCELFEYSHFKLNV